MIPRFDLEVPVFKSRNAGRLVSMVTAVTGAVLVGVLWKYTRAWQNYEMYLVINAMVLFFAPMIVIMFALGEEPASFGFGIGQSRRVLWWTVIMFAALLIVLVPASRTSAFQSYYPIFKQFASFRGGAFVEGDIRGLLYGWATYGMYLFFWEFFFRGYLLFGLARTIKWPAVAVQALAFGFLHLGKVPAEVAASFFAGIALGILALRAKSFLPCFALHWLASVVFDVLVIISKS